MGNLTDDMTRLRGEVDALRGTRGVMLQELTTAVATMRADFTSAHTAMARKTGKARASYVARVKKQVGRMRKENAADITGASQAWFGKAK